MRIAEINGNHLRPCPMLESSGILRETADKLWEMYPHEQKGDTNYKRR